LSCSGIAVATLLICPGRVRAMSAPCSCLAGAHAESKHGKAMVCSRLLCAEAM
jgi:hypothetical protein